MSLAIFIRELATVLRAPLHSTNASWAACKTEDLGENRIALKTAI
jgi:hypothetical protein